MIIGYTFDGQAYPATSFAKMTEEAINYKEGIINGIELTNTRELIMISEGRMLVKGRQFKVLENETVNVGATQSGELFCILIVEIDLDKESTEMNFNQVQFKVISSAIEYPALTKQDINSEREEDTIYQYELARFKNTINGITDFQDMRTFLDFDSIYTAIQKEYRAILSNLKQELESVQDGSAYMLKKEADEVKTKVLKGEDNGDSVVVIIRRNGHIVTVNIELTLKAGSLINYVGFHLDEFPDWAIPKKTYDLDHAKVIAAAYSQLGDEGIINRPQIWFSSSTKRCRIMGAAKNLNVSSSLTDYCTLVYIVDDELLDGGYQLGDVNGDGLINEEDLELLQNYLEGSIGLSDKQKELADVNKDGKLDSGDLFKFRQYLLGQISSFD